MTTSPAVVLPCVDQDLESAVHHALDVEGHVLRITHILYAWVFHHLGVDAVAVRTRFREVMLPLLLLPLLVAAPAGGEEPFPSASAEGEVLLFTNVPRHILGQRLPLPPAGERARGRFWPLIEAAAAGAGLDPRLLTAIIQVESAFNPGATSRRGAQGLMQLMPATAVGYAVRNAYDPEENLRAGARHLRELLDLFAGSLPLALAAYNAGETAVQRFGGIPPFAETQQYVRRVQSRYRALGGRNPLASPQVPRPGPATRIYRIQDPAGHVRYTNLPPALLPAGPHR